jgi:hypothetical protein
MVRPTKLAWDEERAWGSQEEFTEARHVEGGREALETYCDVMARNTPRPSSHGVRRRQKRDGLVFAGLSRVATPRPVGERTMPGRECPGSAIEGRGEDLEARLYMLP